MKHLFSVLAFMVVSFGVQGASHFAINAQYYAGIEFMRDDPIMPLGFLAVIFQGLILSFALDRLLPIGASVRDGVIVSLAFGLFLTTYIALVEPAHYRVPSIPAWMVVEGLASLVQFSLAGVLLGLIHQRARPDGR